MVDGSRLVYDTDSLIANHKIDLTEYGCNPPGMAQPCTLSLDRCCIQLASVENDLHTGTLRRVVFRQELPRLYELKDCIADPTSSDAYFRSFDQNLVTSAHVKDLYLRQERVLRELDDTAWKHLKGEARARLTAYDKRGRGWQQLFDILNEARAYNYLNSVGCKELHFIPRSNRKTPDLTGSLGLERVLCEVKTIGISNDEAAFRKGPIKARSIAASVSPRFMNKLRATIDSAKQQLLEYDDGQACVHLVYLNLSFDDFFAEYKEAYFKQIDDELAQVHVTGVKLVICNEYTTFYKPLKMRFADVDNIG